MRKYTGIETLERNRFLNFYRMDALTDADEPFDYFFTSRNAPEALKLYTGEERSEGVVIFPVVKGAPDRLVLIRQYRYPVGAWLYELPAGLIDPGETAREAAIRELHEETGYELSVVERESFVSRPFYMGAGYTDEACSLVCGWATGAADRKPEATESIEVCLADKAELRRILKEERVSLRLAYLAMAFLQTKEDPFAFIGAGEE